jgi:dihydrodipicolinate synthase/N-acetylneuraminate lyase
MGTVSNFIDRIDFFRVKCALAEMGLIETKMRLPLLPLKARHREMVRASLQKLQMNRIQTGTR